MKKVLLIVGIILGVVALGSIGLATVEFFKVDDRTDYESGRLLGRFVIGLLVLAGYVACLKRGMAKRTPPTPLPGGEVD